MNKGNATRGHSHSGRVITANGRLVHLAAPTTLHTVHCYQGYGISREYALRWQKWTFYKNYPIKDRVDR